MWNLRLITIEERQALDYIPAVGDCFLSPNMHELTAIQSPEYIRDWTDKRPPLYIYLPNGHWWCPDHRFADKDGYKEHGWTITGELPKVTAMPSVNSLCSPGYHGWLQDGVLSDDVEGRKF